MFISFLKGFKGWIVVAMIIMLTLSCGKGNPVVPGDKPTLADLQTTKVVSDNYHGSFNFVNDNGATHPDPPTSMVQGPESFFSLSWTGTSFSGLAFVVTGRDTIKYEASGTLSSDAQKIVSISLKELYTVGLQYQNSVIVANDIPFKGVAKSTTGAILRYNYSLSLNATGMSSHINQIYYEYMQCAIEVSGICVGMASPNDYKRFISPTNQGTYSLDFWFDK